MRRLVIATIATSAPMGQQVYEESICARAAGALDTTWEVKRAIVRSLRAPLPGTARLPARIMADNNAGLRGVAGRYAYGRATVVHRMDLRLPPAAGPEILTIQDAVSWRFPDEAWPPPSASVEARRAARVICPSQFSADELNGFFGLGDITVIPLGVEPGFFAASPLPDDRLLELGLRPPFVLHAGGGSLRKNLRGLAAAWPLVHREHPDITLALMGSRDKRKEDLFGGLDGTLMLGRLDDDLARSVMAAAAALVVPSVYEGFGLPVLEGMAAGVPVVAANRASLPEVAGGDAILVEPSGPGIADGILEVLEGGPGIADLVDRARRRASTFTWDETTRLHAEVWNSF